MESLLLFLNRQVYGEVQQSFSKTHADLNPAFRGPAAILFALLDAERICAEYRKPQNAKVTVLLDGFGITGKDERSIVDLRHEHGKRVDIEAHDPQALGQIKKHIFGMATACLPQVSLESRGQKGTGATGRIKQALALLPVIAAFVQDKFDDFRRCVKLAQSLARIAVKIELVKLAQKVAREFKKIELRHRQEAFAQSVKKSATFCRLALKPPVENILKKDAAENGFAGAPE